MLTTNFDHPTQYTKLHVIKGTDHHTILSVASAVNTLRIQNALRAIKLDSRRYRFTLAVTRSLSLLCLKGRQRKSIEKMENLTRHGQKMPEPIVTKIVMKHLPLCKIWSQLV